MQPQMDLPPIASAPSRSESKNNVPLIVFLTSCGCAFLMIPILAAILFPVFAQARAKARTTVCLSNVKQQTLGVLMYAEDFDERLPVAAEWMTVTQPYVKNNAAMHCSAFPNGIAEDGSQAYGYAYNSHLDRAVESKVKFPSTTPLLYDSSTLTPNATDPLTSLPNPPRHQDRNVMSFADGHAKIMSSANMTQLQIQPQNQSGK